MPSSDKQLAFSVKIAASRELLNKGANIVNMSQGTSPLPKDKGPAEDPLKAMSTKRLHTDAPSSPGYHNVYVRRKVETEHSKVNSSQELKGNGRDKTKEQEEQQNVETEHSKVNSSQELKGNGRDKTKEQEEQKNVETVHSRVNSSQELKGNGRDETKEQEEQQKVQHDQVDKPEMASPIAESGGLVSSEMASPIAGSGGLVSSESPEKTNAETVPEKDEPPIASGNEPPIASGTTVQDNIHRSSTQNQYWSERYNRLQTYLENCDRSTQEGYMRMLRSLSAAGRSMHAIELEKRAIHLLVEEGKELQRMKALNVLGKVSPNGSSKQAPLQRQYQK